MRHKSDCPTQLQTTREGYALAELHRKGAEELPLVLGSELLMLPDRVLQEVAYTRPKHTHDVQIEMMATSSTRAHLRW